MSLKKNLWISRKKYDTLYCIYKFPKSAECKKQCNFILIRKFMEIRVVLIITIYQYTCAALMTVQKRGSMIYEMGGLFGWLITISFAGTILNYILKRVNRQWGRKINTNPSAARLMKILMTVFVRQHKYWGFAAIISLILHFLIQFSRFGINLTGALAAVLMLCQLFLGFFLTAARKAKKKIRVSIVIHRIIAILLIIGIALHLLLPYSLNGLLKNNAKSLSENAQMTASVQTATADSSSVSQAASVTASTQSGTAASVLPIFTLDELSKYDGTNGAKAYVACNGTVYDVTDLPQWKKGSHEGHAAGTDLTDVISQAPHGDSILKNLPVVGTLQN